MLRASLTALFVVLFLISLGLLANGVPAWSFAFASGLVSLGLAFETWRYDRPVGPLTSAWAATDEIFEDPISAKHMRVYFNATTGERRYEEIPPGAVDLGAAIGVTKDSSTRKELAMGENQCAAAPTALYRVVLLMCALAHWWLRRVIIRVQGPSSALATAVGRNAKGNISPIVYAIAIPCAFVEPLIAGALYAQVAMMWLIPDRRIEAHVSNGHSRAEFVMAL